MSTRRIFYDIPNRVHGPEVFFRVIWFIRFGFLLMFIVGAGRSLEGSEGQNLYLQWSLCCGSSCCGQHIVVIHWCSDLGPGYVRPGIPVELLPDKVAASSASP